MPFRGKRESNEMRPLKVDGARDLGAQFTRNPHRMAGQDGAYSIPLGAGKALWFFGDTLTGARTPRESLWFPGGASLGPGDMSGFGLIEKLCTNTALILDEKSGRDGLRNFQYICDASGALKQLVLRQPDEPDVIRVWCLHGCAFGNDLYLFYQLVRMLATGPMPVNFEVVGSGLAFGNSRDWEFQRIYAGNSATWWPADQPQFASAVLPARNEDIIYLYGVLRCSDGVQRCYMARVRSTDIKCLGKYEYLITDAPVWSSNPRDACCIMTGMPNELSVNWNNHLGCYLAVHSLDLTGRIVGRTAPKPWGPWSEPVDLWRVSPPAWDYPVPYPALIYAGKEHAELAEDGGRVLYLTYIEFEEYFPHLVEVTLG